VKYPILPENEVAVLLRTKENEVFTGIAYVATVEARDYAHGLSEWTLTMEGTGEPVWKGLNTYEGRQHVIYQLEKWIKLLKEETQKDLQLHAGG